MTWIQLAILLLKVVNSIISWAHDRRLIDQGYQQAIAEQLAAIAVKTQLKDKIRSEIDALSEKDIDDELRKLEPVNNDKPMHS